jgi:hypothetical protein
LISTDKNQNLNLTLTPTPFGAIDHCFPIPFPFFAPTKRALAGWANFTFSLAGFDLFVGFGFHYIPRVITSD